MRDFGKFENVKPRRHTPLPLQVFVQCQSKECKFITKSNDIKNAPDFVKYLTSLRSKT